MMMIIIVLYHIICIYCEDLALLIGLVGCWVGFLRHINICRLFNAKSICMQIVLFETIQFSIRAQFIYQKHFYFKLFTLVKQF